MRDHIRILGILNIVMGGLSAAIGVAAIMIFGGFSLAASLLGLGAGSDAGTTRTYATYAPFWAIAAIVIGSFFIVLALPSLIGGWGLLKYKPWSRVEMIVVSALHLLNLPVGTAVGIYGLWVLNNEQSRQLLESGGAFPAQSSPMHQQPLGYPPQDMR